MDYSSVFYGKGGKGGKGKKYRQPRLDLYVVRIVHSLDGNLTFANSRPCHQCLKSLEGFNIRKVYYSVSFEENPNGYLVTSFKALLEDPNQHISYGNRNIMNDMYNQHR